MKRPLQVLGFAFTALAIAAAPKQIVVNEANALSFYREFTRITKHPHSVAPLTAALCTIPSQAVKEREKQMTGPHHNARVHVYVNPVAMPVVAKRMTVFPPGSVIVKEKITDDGQVSGVGGMLKRETGYDSSNGDWEYFYLGKPGEFAAGHIESCIGCHRAAKATDYVYSVWNLAE